MFQLFLAILPTIVIVTYILKFDHYHKEPSSLLVRLFFLGCLSVIPAIILETILLPDTISGRFIPLFLYSTLGIGGIEEGVKIFMVFICGYKHHAFDEIYDGIIYCVMVSLGFATIENILYVMQFGTQTALLRMFTAVPAHAIFAISMGYYIGLSKAYPAKKEYYLILSYAVPVLLHGFYDFVLIGDYGWSLIVFVFYVNYLYKKANQLIRQTSGIRPFR